MSRVYGRLASRDDFKNGCRVLIACPQLDGEHEYCMALGSVHNVTLFCD